MVPVFRLGPTRKAVSRSRSYCWCFHQQPKISISFLLYHLSLHQKKSSIDSTLFWRKIFGSTTWYAAKTNNNLLFSLPWVYQPTVTIGKPLQGLYYQPPSDGSRLPTGTYQESSLPKPFMFFDIAIAPLSQKKAGQGQKILCVLYKAIEEFDRFSALNILFFCASTSPRETFFLSLTSKIQHLK